jgi:hypothetical protein
MTALAGFGDVGMGGFRDMMVVSHPRLAEAVAKRLLEGAVG